MRETGPAPHSRGFKSLKPVARPDGCVTAGNASQLSDGASAVIVMSGEEAERKGLQPLGYFRGYASVGLEPDEMGIGPDLRGSGPLGSFRSRRRRHRSVGTQ